MHLPDPITHAMMKREYKIIFYGVAAILAFWLIDAFVDFVAYYNEPYWKVLLLNKTQVSLSSAGLSLFSYF